MLETWVVISIAGAFFQNLRSALQKHLKGNLSNTAAAYSRFVFALPFALLYLLSLVLLADKSLPPLNYNFFIYCLLGSVAQILFTVVLLWLFSFKSFAVGTTLSKLEVVVVAVLGAMILQDKLSAVAITAMLIVVAGVVTLTVGQTGVKLHNLLRQVNGRETGVGLLCAFFLGASVVCFRGASLSLEHDDAVVAAALSLFVALVMQTLIMGVWITWRESGQWKKLAQQWRWGSVVGAAGVLTSICWFTAFTLQNAGYVRAVGTVELLFTYFFSTRIFKERVTAFEATGMVLVAAGIVLLLLRG